MSPPFASASIGVFPRFTRGEHAARDEQPRGRDALIEFTFRGAAQVDEDLFGALLAHGGELLPNLPRRVRSERGHTDETDAWPHNPARDRQTRRRLPFELQRVRLGGVAPKNGEADL